MLQKLAHLVGLTMQHLLHQVRKNVLPDANRSLQQASRVAYAALAQREGGQL
ncbi:MAG: hypothetical protein IPH82_04395 [Chloroflexi bacterium]|nr:hypothetical protein [Chloroflexota bacterium]